MGPAPWERAGFMLPSGGTKFLDPNNPACTGACTCTGTCPSTCSNLGAVLCRSTITVP
ncbi:MAG TPA: hypothetical protein VGQ83_18755 [Polyangia bacterium]